MGNTRRRLLASMGLVLVAPVLAQPSAAKVPRVGVLLSAATEQMGAQVEALRVGMRDLGYVEGRNFGFEFLSAEGAYERLPALAAELVRLRVDVIAAVGTPAALAAKRATTTMPIVMVVVGDPIQTGLVASLARPGGNVTGTSILSPQIVAKRLELLKAAQPRLRRIAILLNPSNPAQKLSLETVQSAADALKVELGTFEARNLDEIVKAFSAMAGQGMDAVVFANDVVFTSNAAAIVALAGERRLATAGPDELARAGVLIGYGSFIDVYRHSATYIVRILNGAKPRDLPVEQASKFEVVLNARTAKALGLAIPPSFYSRADRVIE